ncbi:lysM and putative peptidoglycan-binding domain-containing protein 1 [Uranotaenia lowii]|uniref:lysM and putative peptidoglycan-binding domain-containing protein 1 n=1 Tax=Uranotaenia lowii TaxID=190385 RepID=UPI00247AE529|nr:lysM and putative peptidoglycan-binding domain-containing protein 1 [Uranotaenia lowii]XP_055588171.1 lysM and putative peptidoglycan-binding domain-containing protein 1 [Uranotaenia lowii]XP_055588172.1 lysM and putative peptidoglycan-binding domain-containing protein 1 [Uranotaenia lowii]
MSLDTMQDLVKKYKNWKSYIKFVKLVSDGAMEDETIFGEKQSIRDSAKTLKKYGSISTGGSTGSSRSPVAASTEALIRHDVDRTDTLQGIALKYGCSMEQIRRINRLLPTDTIFLRTFLMIPVEKDSPFYPKDPAAIIRPNSLSVRSASLAGGPSTSSGSSTPMDPGISEESSSGAAISPEEESRKNMEEFLGKIDSSIASMRKYIAESQRNSEFISSQSDDNIFSSGASMNSSGYYSKPRAYSTASSSSSISSYQQYHFQGGAGGSGVSSSAHHHQPNHKRQSSSGSTASDTSQLIVMTQGKRVQSSLQKLEKQQDELFEL